MAIPTDPETLLTRAALAEALTEAGFPVSRATLATKASRAVGRRFGNSGHGPYIRGAVAWSGRDRSSAPR